MEIYWNERKDYLGLSTDTKETINVVNGSTFYEVDTGIFSIFYKGEWYAQGVTPEVSEEIEQTEET